MKILTSERDLNGYHGHGRPAIQRMVAAVFSEWALGLVALMVIVMAVLPWHPAPPNTYGGLDRSLLFVDRQANAHEGAVRLDSSSASLFASPGTQPVIHVLTSLTSFKASFDVSITAVPGYSGTPLEIRVWYPGSQSSVFIRFNSAEQVNGGTQEKWRDRTPAPITTYRYASSSHVEVQGNPGQSVRFEVTDPYGITKNYAVGGKKNLSLFRQPYLDMSVGSLGTVNGTASVLIQKFRLTTPSRSYLATRISDPRASIAALLVVAWFLVYLVRRLGNRNRVLAGPPQRLMVPRISVPPGVGLILLGAMVLLALYAAIAFIDGHPYDRLSQETWSYVLQHYGLGSLYDRTITAPDSAVRGGGPPWSTLGYSYPPGMIYPYAFFAAVWKLVGPISPLHDRLFYVFWKLCFSAFVLLDGLLIYAIATRITSASPRWARMAAILFVLNPAIIFDATVWGETDALLTAALLVSAFGLLGGKVRLGFAGIAIACLLKQTALFFLPLFLLYSLKRYGVRPCLQAAAFGIVTGFVFIAPTVLVGYHPGTAYPQGLVQLKSFALPSYTWVSADTSSVWTLLTPLNGYHGFDRIWPPTISRLPGTPFGYSTIGSVLFLSVVALSLVAVARVPKHRLSEPAVLRWAGVVPLAFVIFSTTASVRYLTLGLPFLLISIRRPSSIKGVVALVVYGAMSVLGLVSMYGLFSVIAERGEWINFNGLGNATTDALTHAVHAAYTSDLGITVMAAGLLASLAATVWLAVTSAPAPAKVNRRSASS